jgi:hypothetical protein
MSYAPDPDVPPPRGPLAVIMEPRVQALLIHLPPGPKTHHAIRAAVGGDVVPVAVGGSHWIIYVHEDGIPLRLPPNAGADVIARMLGFPFRPGDFLRGPAVLLGRDGFADTDVPDDVLALARRAGVLA